MPDIVLGAVDTCMNRVDKKISVLVKLLFCLDCTREIQLCWVSNYKAGRHLAVLGSRQWGFGMGWGWEDLTEAVTFEQRPEQGNEGKAMLIRGRMYMAERASQSPGGRVVPGVLVKDGKPVWLERGEPGGEQRR